MTSSLPADILPGIDPWGLLMQAIASERQEQGHEETTFTISMSIMSPGPATTRRARLRAEPAKRADVIGGFVSKYKDDGEIMELVELASELYLKKSPRRKLRPVWLKAAERIHELKPPGFIRRIDRRRVAAVLRRLIEDAITETSGSRARLYFTSSWFHETMKKAGYTDSNKASAKKWDQKKRARQARMLKAGADLFESQGRMFFESRLEYYRMAKDILENSDHQEKTRLLWTDFMDQLVFAMGVAISATDRRIRIYPHTHHIAAAVLRDEYVNGKGQVPDENRARSEYRRIYTRLRDELIIWAQMADSMITYDILGFTPPPKVPLFRPYSMDVAIFWGYHGTRCRRCKSWHVRGTDHRMARCSACGETFEPEVMAHCTQCWRGFVMDRKKFADFSCKSCKRPVRLYEPRGKKTMNCIRTNQRKITEIPWVVFKKRSQKQDPGSGHSAPETAR